jgi:4a-hydroxytetrahydrobiopterin dehydratase
MTHLLEPDAIRENLAGLQGWRQQGTAIAKSYRFADFVESFAFMTACALKAEAANHHPDWFNSYNRVDVTLTTHDKGGITSKDINLAKAMDAIMNKMVTSGNRPAKHL